MSERGPLCGSCHADDELADAQKTRWFSFPNLLAAAFLSGGVVCSIEINGVQYGSLVMGPLALLCGLGLLWVAVSNKLEPLWLRAGRAAVVLLVAAYHLIVVIPLLWGLLVPSNSGSADTLDSPTPGLVQACENADFDACASVGRLYQKDGLWDGAWHDKDPLKAREFLGKACKGSGGAEGCNDLGILFQDGVGGAPDPKGALPLFEQACDGGDRFGCYNLALALQQGNGAAVDKSKAFTWWERACVSEKDATWRWSESATSVTARGKACVRAAVYLDAPGPANDDAKAAARYRLACELDQFVACNDLAVMLQNGEGITADPKEAVAMYERACKGANYRGCYNLATMFEEGLGVPKDPPRVIAIYSKTCDAGEARACRLAGNWYLPSGEVSEELYTKAVPFWRRACDGDDVTGCYNLGVSTANGQGVEKDPTAAAAVYAKACDGSSWNACNNLGNLFRSGRGLDKDEAKARELFGRACDADLALGCDNLASILHEGPKALRDLDGAVTAADKACELKRESSCARKKKLCRKRRKHPKCG